MALTARDILGEIKVVSKQIHRGKVKNLMLGENKSLRIGEGYDIHTVCEWQPGYPLEHVDFEASLPTWPKKIYILEMFEQKNAPLIIVSDISPSIFVETNTNSGKFRLMLQLLGGLGLGAGRIGDPVGFLGFSDKIDFYIPPKSGSGWIIHSSKMIHSIAERFDNLKKRGQNLVSSYNLNLAFKFLASRLPQRQCSIVVLSDFADIISSKTELDLKLVKALSGRHNWNLIAIFLDDPEEFKWNHPLGKVRVVDAETNNVALIKSTSARTIRQRFVDDRQKIRENLKKCGVDSEVISFGDHFNQLGKFLSERISTPR